MNINQLISAVKQRGIRLWVDDGKLQFKGPAGAMDSELKQYLVQHKPELITLLSRQVAPQQSQIETVDVAPGTLSFAQARLLFMSDTFGASTAYNMPSVYCIKGLLDIDKLKAAWAELIERHQALRTAFVKHLGEYRAEQVQSDSLPFSLIEQNEQNEQDSSTIQSVLSETFDLSKAPLARLTLIKSAQDEYQLVLNMHHAISDGWSNQILWRELWALYQGQTLAAPETQYTDFVHWQTNWLSSPQYDKQAQFWFDYLHGASELIDLPLDYPRPATPDYQGRVVHFTLSDSTAQKLELFNQRHGSSGFISLLSALYFVLFKYTGQSDICIGTPVANRRIQSWESVVGFFANVITLRHQLDDNLTLSQLNEQIRDNVLTVFEHQDFPFEKVVEKLQPERSLSYSPLFQVMFNYDLSDEQNAQVTSNGLQFDHVVEELGVSKFDMTVTLKRNGDSLLGGIEYATALFDQSTMEQFARHFAHVVEVMLTDDEQTLAQLSVFDAQEKQQLLSGFDGPVIELSADYGVHQLIAQKAAQQPSLIALKDGNESLTYSELNQQVAIVAGQLFERGIVQGNRVGVSVERGVPMVVAMLAVMTCGAAYVPVDVNFPLSRKQQICEDAQLTCVISNPAFAAPFNDWSIEALLLDQIDMTSTPIKALTAYPAVKPTDLAYVIYTSGSTGRPKGVMVSHGNVVNLFAGLDESLTPSLEGCGAPKNEQPVFRALTSISFDISVLELFWTLARGFKVIVEQDHFTALADERAQAQKVNISDKAAELDFSMFYFASDQTGCDDKYFLLREGATFADNNGFSAVWVPERHFHDFGGQFANPAIAAAAVSMLTKNIEIRSGSCVLPLHNIIRVAEEWSMVDNMSNGRVAMAVASGWHFQDFVLAPDNYDNRHQILKDSVQTLRKLWGGEKVSFVNGKGTNSDIQIHPKPIRAELPLWVTAAANPETFRYAGSIGANVLTHFLGQSAAELKDKIAIYHQALTDNGFDATKGKVTLMLHTYLSDDYDKAMATIEKPFKDYLRTSINLLLPVAQSTGLDTKEDLEAVVDAGFLRYAKTSALFGTPESCLQLASDMSDIGVTEIGCLIDFGVEDNAVVESFVHIKRFKDLLKHKNTDAVELDQSQATHIQCTPSYAQLLLASDETRQSLKYIRGFMVGGEPLTPELAEQINQLIPGKLFNMYGPTETTVWSAVNQVKGNDANIGLPIANTRLYVLDEHLQIVPTGVKGELYIAGLGVTPGYWQRPDLTEKQFLPDPYSSIPGVKLYRTGDLVRRLSDGRMVFVGRIDNQVKVRGYRIELDEIKQALADYDGVEQAIVTVHRTEQKAAAILAYVLPQTKLEQPLQSSALIEHLKTRVPDYMVPSAMFILTELPYTPNGKLDLKALPTEVAAQPRQLVPVANDTESKVADIWKALLDIEQIGTQESFFELGGHSLLLGKMQQQLKDDFDLTIEIIDLFKYPTISTLSQKINTMMAPVKTEQKRNTRQVDRASVNQIRNQMRQRNRRGK